MLLRGREKQYCEWPLGSIGREVARDPFGLAIGTVKKWHRAKEWNAAGRTASAVFSY
jgi:hypothetical protein